MKSGGGGGNSGGMEERLVKVESAVDHMVKAVSDLKTEIRDLRNSVETGLRETRQQNWQYFLYSAGISVATLGLMAKGFKWF